MWNYDETKDYLHYRPLGRLCLEACWKYGNTKNRYALPKNDLELGSGDECAGGNAINIYTQYSLEEYRKMVPWYDEYEEAAKQGDACAQRMLGVCYKNGLGVPQDDQKAAYWYEEAAKQGDACAQYILGTWYEAGEKVPQDYQKSTYWYEKAANQENINVSDDLYVVVSAQYKLAVCYENGQGVLKDKKKAMKWYKKAAALGDENAIQALKRLKKNGFFSFLAHF